MKKNIFLFFMIIAMLPMSVFAATDNGSEKSDDIESCMLDQKAGYVQMNHFSKLSVKLFAETIKALREKGMTSLVIDMQNNVDEVSDASRDFVCDFFNANETILKQSDKYGKTLKVSKNGLFYQGRVVVLVGKRNRSAAELVAKVMLDNKRGVVIGELANDELKLSEVVENDTSYMTQWYNDIINAGIEEDVVNAYLKDNREKMESKYTKGTMFMYNFSDNEGVLSLVRDMAEKKGVVYNVTDYRNSAFMVFTQIKAMMARELFPKEKDVYFRILNIRNSVVRRAAGVICTNDYVDMIGG